MFEKLKNIGKEEIFRGSLILFLMMNTFNFLNALFQFLLGRFLGPVEYGVLAFLMNLLLIFDIPVEGIYTIVSRYTSKLNVKKEYGKIKYILIKTIEKSLIISSILFVLYIPISFVIGYYADISWKLIIFSGLLLFGIFILAAIRGVMQGRKEFFSLGTTLIIESGLKLILALIFVFFGFRVFGAMVGVVLSVFLSIVICFLFIKTIVKSNIEKPKRGELKGIYHYGVPVVLVILTILLISSLDIIFAKIYFPADVAGKYAAASMIGKIILFGTMAITKAMFPIVSESHDKGEKTRNLLNKSFLLIFVCCLLGVLVYFLFPKLIVLILFGSQFTDIANMLVILGIGFSLLSLTNLFLMYSLSVYKKKPGFFIFFVAIEILFFYFMHSDLMQFSIGFMLSNLIMFIISLFYIIKD